MNGAQERGRRARSRGGNGGARSAMMCGLTKRQAAEVAELKIFIRSNQNGQD